jgi:general secretion pathway protein M
MALNISRRERLALYLAGAFICLFILIQWVLVPLTDRQHQLDRVLAVKRHALEQMIALKSEFETIQAQSESSKNVLGNREKGFSLFSFLDALAGKIQIKERIAYMKPSTAVQKDSPLKTSQVEMKLEAITLKQLTDYLFGIEMSPNRVWVRRMALSRTEKPEGFIDAVLQVETHEM